MTECCSAGTYVSGGKERCAGCGRIVGDVPAAKFVLVGPTYQGDVYWYERNF